MTANSLLLNPVSVSQPVTGIVSRDVITTYLELHVNVQTGDRTRLWLLGLIRER